jgi:ribosomal protein S18 acetylase RimI-like enzyme
VDIRSLAFRTDLALLRLAGSEIEDRGDRLVVRSPRNPAFYWGNFFLLAGPPKEGDAEALVAEYDAEFAESRHRSFGVDGTGDQRTALAELIALGPRVEDGAVMTATSVHPPPRPNAEAELRRLASDDDWAQRVTLAMDVDGGEHDAELHLQFATQRAIDARAFSEAGHGAYWGAFVEGRLASVMGLVDAGSGLARYQNVETHPDFRGRGLAGTLVHRVATYGFDELGARTLVMVADPDYLAIRIYRSVGFEVTETQTQLEQRDRTK